MLDTIEEAVAKIGSAEKATKEIASPQHKEVTEELEYAKSEEKVKPVVSNNSTGNAMPQEIVKHEEKPRNVENVKPLGVTKPAEKPRAEAIA